MDYIRFRWLCLPRWLRGLLIALALVSVALAILSAIVLGYIFAVDTLLKLFGVGVAVIGGVFIILVPTMAFLLWDQIEPSIKKKEKQ